jgi:hypothetical protein
MGVSFHSVNGVRDYMQENLNQLIGVSLDDRCIALFINFHVNVVLAFGTSQIHGTFQERPDIHGRTM